jgi:hypothetical protein
MRRGILFGRSATAPAPAMSCEVQGGRRGVCTCKDPPAVQAEPPENTTSCLILSALADCAGPRSGYTCSSNKKRLNVGQSKRSAMLRIVPHNFDMHLDLSWELNYISCSQVMCPGTAAPAPATSGKLRKGGGVFLLTKLSRLQMEPVDEISIPVIFVLVSSASAGMSQAQVRLH